LKHFIHTVPLLQICQLLLWLFVVICRGVSASNFMTKSNCNVINTLAGCTVPLCQSLLSTAADRSI